MNNQLKQKLYWNNSPKRILALDGGGIRGILTLGMLEKIEQVLRQKAGRHDLVLSDYYDLIGGTSTGAIIASLTALGKPVSDIIQLYQSLGHEIFGKGRKYKLIGRHRTSLRALFKENYSSANMEKYLQSVFKDVAIGDGDALKCGLAINSKRADTYSLWTVTNHPDGMYFGANAHLKIWELCRASSAAPYYFRPKKLKPKTRKMIEFEAVFIDGGVSLANYPAWQTFLVATVPGFGYAWLPSKDNILITTLGTGNGETKEEPNKLENLRTIEWASKLSNLFMVDALEMNQVSMEVLGNNVGPKKAIDSQYGDLSKLHPPLLKNEHKLFTFERHNVYLDIKYLSELGVSVTEEQVQSLREMDHYENMDLLLQIGRTYAEKNLNSFL